MRFLQVFRELWNSLSTVTKKDKMWYSKKYNLAKDKSIKVNTPWVLSMIIGSFSPAKERQFTDEKLYHLKIVSS